MKRHFLFGLIVLLTLASQAQKIEKESRIASEKVPTKALEFIFNATASSKIKWYYEKNELGNSYEAKFLLKKQKVSVEFDLKGNLQDVEIEISKSKIPSKIRKQMRKYFKIYFNKYRILKVQKQFRGEDKPIIESIKSFSILKNPPTFFEIVVIGKKVDNVHSTEFLFDAEGNLIGSKKVVEKNSDHLTF